MKNVTLLYIIIFLPLSQWESLKGEAKKFPSYFSLIVSSETNVTDLKTTDVINFMKYGLYYLN